MMSVKRLLREPLLHFLVAGILLFVVFSLTHRLEADAASDRTITLNEESLLTFVQYRSKAFKPDYFAVQLEAMSAWERSSLEDQFAEEEILYREAKALGLERGDYVIRQRLVQKMRFLIDDLVETGARPSDTTLAEYFQKNRRQYVVEPSVTFTHVFVDPSVHGGRAAQDRAERLKTRLNASGAGFGDAPRFGDRFPFLQNYVDRTVDYVVSHFGNDFVSEVMSLAPSQTQWSGPLRSTHGYHVVLVTHRTEARLPELDEIRAQVEDDWLRDRMEAARSRAMTHLAAQYVIERLGRSAEVRP